MKKYGKQFVIVLLAAAVLMALSSALGMGGAGGLVERTLKNDWQLELPRGYEVEYRSATDAKIKDGGLRYHALMYADDTVLNDWLPWVSCNMPTAHADSAAELVREVMDSLNVPGGERPDLQNSGVWYAEGEDGSELLLLHTEGDLRLYIVESIR